MHAKFLTPAFVFTLVCVLLTGCAGRSYRVSVSGFADPTSASKRSYWLISGNTNVSVDSLEFREYAACLKRGLSQNKFDEAPSFEKADVVILFSYGVGDTRAEQFSIETPVFGQTGGGYQNFRANTYSTKGITTTYGTVYQTPTFGVVGSRSISGTDYTSSGLIWLDAVDARVYAKEKKIAFIWRIIVQSRGVNPDMRKLVPVYISAAAPYFGMSTRERIVVVVNESDKTLQEIKAE